MSINEIKEFYKNKTVLVTGHTGFKGAWLSIWLHSLGAKVIGYSLNPQNEKDLFYLSNIKDKIIDIRGDVRDLGKLKQVFQEYNPEIVFHLAAQPIVRESYEKPHYTFETNIIGTVNVLECIKESNNVKSAVIITTDKCYKNKEWVWGYKEEDELGGHDPYSASKACVEIVVESYRKSFFTQRGIRVATARAGNVLGGGDWAKDRIIPDSIKALAENVPIPVRNPDSTRPWQHVLDPLSGYLMLGQKLADDGNYSGAWNFGPDSRSIAPVRKVVDLLIKEWGAGTWEYFDDEDKKHEAKSLSLNVDKAKFLLGWEPTLNLAQTIGLVVEWYKNYQSQDVYDLSIKQIEFFLSQQKY